MAESLGVRRETAQRIAYVMRQTGAIQQVGKQGNAILYERLKKRCRKAVKRKKRPQYKRGSSVNLITAKTDPTQKKQAVVPSKVPGPITIQGL